MDNVVTTTQSTTPSQQQHHELSEMGMGPVGAAQPNGCVTGISVPGSRKSHVVAGISDGFCPPGWHWHCPPEDPHTSSQPARSWSPLQPSSAPSQAPHPLGKQVGLSADMGERSCSSLQKLEMSLTRAR